MVIPFSLKAFQMVLFRSERMTRARQGSDEHREVDINAIVEESLNLAYHGARAERQDFDIELVRELDPEVGRICIYPQ